MEDFELGSGLNAYKTFFKRINTEVQQTVQHSLHALRDLKDTELSENQLFNAETIEKGLNNIDLILHDLYVLTTNK